MKSPNNHSAPSYILRALKEIGTEAIGVGPEELRFGTDQLKDINAQSSIPLVSANISGFQTYSLLSKNQGQTKVLVTSVVDPELLQHMGITVKGITDPAVALEDLSQNIRHDLFIVIVHAEDEPMRSLIQTCPGIDLVIDGESNEVSHQKGMNKLPVVSNNQKGEYVSYLDFYKKNASEFYSKNPVDLRAEVGIVAEDAAIKSLIRKYDKEISDYYRQADTHNDSSGTQNQNQYVGSQSCMPCHSRIGKLWSESKHARAMESLKKKSKEFDPDCLSCHTTAFTNQKTLGGSFEMDRNRLMTGVECEACHGPGQQHAQAPMDAKMSSITRETCKQCHTSGKDPHFDVANHKWQIQSEGCNVAVE